MKKAEFVFYNVNITKNARQVLSNAKAMKIELSTDEYQTIEQAFNQFKQIKSGIEVIQHRDNGRRDI